eukprot:g6319.t1
MVPHLANSNFCSEGSVTFFAWRVPSLRDLLASAGEDLSSVLPWAPPVAGNESASENEREAGAAPAGDEMEIIPSEYTCRAPQERREATVSRTATSPNVGNNGQEPEPVRKRRIVDLPPESELPCGPGLRMQLLMRSVNPRRNAEGRREEESGSDGRPDDPTADRTEVASVSSLSEGFAHEVAAFLRQESEKSIPPPAKWLYPAAASAACSRRARQKINEPQLRIHYDFELGRRTVVQRTNNLQA